jgi:hypothetical protein
MHKLLAGVISIATGSEIALRSRRSSREPVVVAPAVGPCGGRGLQQVWLPWRRLHHRLQLSCKRSQQDRPSSGPLYAGVSLSASAGFSADVTPVYEANDGIQPCCTPRCSEDSNQSPCEVPGLIRNSTRNFAFFCRLRSCFCDRKPLCRSNIWCNYLRKLTGKTFRRLGNLGTRTENFIRNIVGLQGATQWRCHSGKSEKRRDNSALTSDCRGGSAPARSHVEAAQLDANDNVRQSSSGFVCASDPVLIRPIARKAKSRAA